MGVQGEKSLGILSNSEPVIAVDSGSEGIRGKLDVQEGNNPDRG